MLQALGDLHNVVARVRWNRHALLALTLGELRMWGRRFPPVPLCIQAASTDESITFKFAPKGRYWPSLRIEEGDLEVFLPRWTAAVCVCGALLTAGAWDYNQWLDIQLKRAELTESDLDHELRREQIQQARTETELLVAKIQKIRSSEPRSEDYATKLDIEAPLNLFARQVHSRNIKSAEVNGVPIKHQKR